jgi:hypothetical protein
VERRSRRGCVSGHCAAPNPAPQKSVALNCASFCVLDSRRVFWGISSATCYGFPWVLGGLADGAELTFGAGAVSALAEVG